MFGAHTLWLSNTVASRGALDLTRNRPQFQAGGKVSSQLPAEKDSPKVNGGQS
jgi:hypothetical protein